MPDTKQLKTDANEIVKTVFSNQPFTPQGDKGYVRELLLTIYPVIKSYHLRLSAGLSSLIGPFEKSEETNDMKLFYAMVFAAMQKNIPGGQHYYYQLHALGNKLDITDEEFTAAGKWGNPDTHVGLASSARSAFAINTGGIEHSMASTLAYWFVMQSIVTWFIEALINQSINRLRSSSIPFIFNEGEALLFLPISKPDLPESLFDMEMFKHEHIQNYFLGQVELHCKEWNKWFQLRAKAMAESAISN